MINQQEADSVAKTMTSEPAVADEANVSQVEQSFTPVSTPASPAVDKVKSKRPIDILTSEARIKQLQRHSKDVGSSEVQIGLLTDRILHLTAHLKNHPKDKHTNYGLRKMVARRKKLLTYLEHTQPEKHTAIKSTLKLR